MARRQKAKGRSESAHGGGSGADFFISYTEADRAWAEWIAVELEHAGYVTVVQAFEFRPSSDFLHHMEHALDTAARMLAVISPAYFASDYCMLEWRAAIVKDPTGNDGFLLPVRVRDGDPPDLYASRVYTDLVGHVETTARKKILASVAKYRAHPETRTFPGPDGTRPRRPRYPDGGPDISNLPARNPHFTGRDTILIELYRQLHSKQRTAIVPTGAVHGLDGVGKTQTALEYAHRYASDFDIIWWIDAEQSATTASDLAVLARRLGINHADDQPDTIRALLDGLRQRDRWLLIYDNAEQPQQLKGFLPAGGGGHVLITSRWADWADATSSFALAPMTRAESLAFLRKRTGRADPAEEHDLDTLANVLGDLSLALDEAAAYLRRTGETTSGYLNLIRERTRDLFGGDQPAAGGGLLQDQRRIATIWTLSLDRVRDQAPAAEALLNLLAFLSSDTPRSLLPGHPDTLPDELAEAVADQVAYNEALATLAAYSLVALTPDTISVHRLVQTVTRARMSDDQTDNYLIAAIDLLHATSSEQSSEYTNWPSSERLLHHLLAVADHARQQHLATGDLARLIHHASAYLRERGQYTTALSLAHQALTITEAVYGPEHADMAPRRNNLGLVMYALGNHVAARTQIETAITIGEATLGSNHRYLAAWRNNLGNVLRAIGDYTAARTEYETAIHIGETTLPADHPDLAAGRNNLGKVLVDLGDYTAAREHIETAIHIGETTLGPNHPHIAAWHNNLGLVLAALGEYRAAQAEYEAAIRMGEITLGPNHPHLAAWRNNLGVVLAELGDHNAAHAEYLAAIGIGEAALGPLHPHLAARRNNLGSVLRALGDYTAAREHIETAIDIGETTLGPNHPHIAAWHNNLGSVLAALGDPNGARIEHEKAVHIGETTLGPRHPHLAAWRNNLGTDLAALGDYTAAREHIEAAIDIGETTLGPNHPDLGAWRNNLGTVLAALGDYTAARTEFTAAVHIGETGLSPRHPDLAARRNNLGLALASLDDYWTARTEIEAAIHIGEATLGPNHPHIAAWRNNLGVILRRMGDYPAARAETEAAIHIGETALGPNHPDAAAWRNNLGLALRALGDYPGARAEIEAAIHIGEATLGPNHPDASGWRNSLAIVLFDMGEYADARSEYETAVRIAEATLPADHPDLSLYRRNLNDLLARLQGSPQEPSHISIDSLP